MSLSQQAALAVLIADNQEIQQPILANAGETAAALSTLKDAQEQASENAILRKYPTIVNGIRNQVVALSDSFTCSVSVDQLSELQPVLENLGYTVSKGALNPSTNRITVTIQWKAQEETLALTGVSPTNLELCLNYAYSTTFYPQGGTAPYKFKLKAGQLPQGTTLTTTVTTATLSGTPTLTGVDYMVIETTDATGLSKTTTVPWIVKAVIGVQQPQPVIVEIKMDYITGTVPLTSKGQLGDKVGRVAADSNYIYYCTATYVTQLVQPDIWKRVALTGSTWS